MKTTNKTSQNGKWNLFEEKREYYITWVVYLVRRKC